MGFNLEDYEDVNARIQRFQKAFSTGRIEVDVIHHDIASGCILVRALVYREHTDTHPAAIDIAFGQRDLYPQNLRKFYCEDTSTSAIGRALALVLETSAKPTRQDMERVEQSNKFEKRLENFKQEAVQVENPKDAWTIVEKPMPLPVSEAVAALNDGVTPEQIPTCPIHKKPMEPREGNSKGKAWKHYKCNVWPDKCEQIVWMEIDKTGRWVPQRPRPTQGAIN